MHSAFDKDKKAFTPVIHALVYGMKNLFNIWFYKSNTILTFILLKF